MEEIFMYTDYRKYLNDKYFQLKKTQPVFSYRYFSKKAGFASPNFLKLVIERKRNLSQESIHKFAEALKLPSKERLFFEILVQYDQASTPQLRQHYYQQLLNFPEYRKVHHLEKEQYEFLSQWYYAAIVELVGLPDFSEDPDWISKRLRKRVSPGEAKEAIATLLKIKLLERNAEGKLAPSHQALTTGEEAQSLAAFSFHEQILESAKEALSQQMAEEREFAAITMAINETQLKKLKQMVRDFRKMVLNYLAQKEGDPTAVYQFSAQIFSVTEMEKKQGENRTEKGEMS